MTATIDDADFTYIRDLVHRGSGILLEADKQYLVHTRLAPLATGAGGLGSLVENLRRRPHDPLHAQVIEAFTTNETSFFRDPALFEALRTTLLPELLEQASASRELTVWSAACSTGQEAYSLLMLLRTSFPQLAGWRVTVVGTDLSHAAIEKARAGTYTKFEVSRGLPDHLRAEFFSARGAEWEIDRRLRDQLKVHHLNLGDSWARIPACDLVLMRNVLIYFDADTKERLLRRAAAHLKPHGRLILGSTERPTGAEDVLGVVNLPGAKVYRRTRQR